MKITEITRSTGTKLVEAIEQDNDTGCNPADLSLIVEAHRTNEWSLPILAEDYISQMKNGTLKSW
jgi:hypothetical protein